jgi:tryptophanyl-tRNA synthetase
MKTIFSGIQPSGDLHIGNYIGAIKQWVDMEKNADPHDRYIFMMADMHTITVPQEKGELEKHTLELTAWYLAAGLNPERVIMFVQSQNPDHAYLTWVFDCITPMGWMERMTQYKDKSAKQGERTSVGLFHYPNLMATDILLYDTNIVPVGEDQTQHIELTRDIAKKFNTRFGEVLTIPSILLQKHGARIMSLQNPMIKMSKSDENKNGAINLLDNADEIRSKISKAVTDSGTDILFKEDKPALSNLLTIYSIFSGMVMKFEVKFQKQ